MTNDLTIRQEGVVDISIFDRDTGKTEIVQVKNRILRSGRVAFANSLANSFGSTYEYFITGISFGSGGTSGGALRVISEDRAGLFGSTLTTKPVISSINSSVPYKVTFTSVLLFDELVGQTINEMALRMYNEEYFSMTVFGDISKTSSMQLTFNWSVSML